MPVRGEGGGLRSLTRTPVVAGGPGAPPALSKCAVTVTILDSRGSSSGSATTNSTLPSAWSSPAGAGASWTTPSTSKTTRSSGNDPAVNRAGAGTLTAHRRTPGASGPSPAASRAARSPAAPASSSTVRMMGAGRGGRGGGWRVTWGRLAVTAEEVAERDAVAPRRAVDGQPALGEDPHGATVLRGARAEQPHGRARRTARRRRRQASRARSPRCPPRDDPRPAGG